MNREPLLVEKIIMANSMRGIDWLAVSIMGILLSVVTLTVFSSQINHLLVIALMIPFLLAFAHLRFWGFRQNVNGITVNFNKNLIIYLVITVCTVIFTYFSRDFILFALALVWGGFIYFNLAALVIEEKRGNKDFAYALISTIKTGAILGSISIAALYILEYIHKLA